MNKIYLVWWELLLMNYIKIKFDGLVRCYNLSIWYIIRDYYGRMIIIRAVNLGENTILLVEAIILRVSKKSNIFGL